MITPTYNRAKTLPRVWKSLQTQTFQDFEWVVVDGGSTDETPELVAEWQQLASFPIHIIHLGRRGKPAADNAAVNTAQGKFICPMDSDDTYTPEAIQTFLDAWNAIPTAEQDKFCGVAARTRDATSGEPNGPPFRQNPFDVGFMDLYYTHGRREEHALFIRRDVLLKHPFPEIDDFVPESVVWHAIGRTLRTRCIDAVVRTVHADTPGSLTQSQPFQFARGRAHAIACFINDYHSHFGRSPPNFIQTVLTYGRFSRNAKVRSWTAMLSLAPTAAKVIFWAVYPVSLGLALRDRINFKRNL